MKHEEIITEAQGEPSAAQSAPGEETLEASRGSKTPRVWRLPSPVGDTLLSYVMLGALLLTTLAAGVQVAVTTDVKAASSRAGLSQPGTPIAGAYRLASTNRSALRKALAAKPPVSPQVHSSLQTFYQQNDLRTAWFFGGVLKPAALPLLERLQACPTAALPGDLQPARLLERAQKMIAEGGEAAAVAALDRDLSAAFLSCVEALRQGAPGVHPRQHGWEVDLPGPDGLTLLTKALGSSSGSLGVTEGTQDGTTAEDGVRSALEENLPNHPQFQLLASALVRYETIAATGGWSTGLKIEDTWKPGDKIALAQLAKLSARLQKEGFLAADANPLPNEPRYEGALVTAIEAYQQARGLAVDGKLGDETVASLNVPVEERIQQLRINLQRSLWLNEDAAGTAVTVNIPAFRLQVTRGGEIVHRQNVVVGKRSWQTPIFRDQIELVVTNPTWNVPESIAVDEIIPQLREEPEYLQKKGFQVLSGWGADAEPMDPYAVDWDKVEAGETQIRFRQKPGPTNALGSIKFLFPNSHAVYLHDTPAQRAFLRADRAQSHGCVRVENPRELARVLLPEDVAERVESRLKGTEPATLSLPEPIPVQLVYMTAWVEEDGRVQFFDDVYEMDSDLGRAVERWNGVPVWLAADQELPTTETAQKSPRQPQSDRVAQVAQSSPANRSRS
ncbi:MAG: L,D-transpeptidase family protein [Acidobacteriota bacterium]|nr:L,D-transpeptidase family protein [Acidobacteriota bacterium]